MKKKAKQQKSTTASRTSWRAVPIIVVSVLLFLGGFFYAGRQHFLSIDYGMKNSKLRKQIEQLESEKRRLILAKETSLSPAEIKKAAKKLGILERPTTDATTAELASASIPAKPSIRTPRTADPAPLVTKTALVAGAEPAARTLVAKVDKNDKPERARYAESTPRPAKKAVAAE